MNDNYANSDTITVIIDNTSAHPAPVENIDISFLLPGQLVRWDMVEDERFVSYSLFRSEKANMDSSVALYTTSVAADTVYFDSLANPLVTYYYQVMVTDLLNYLFQVA